MTDISAIRTNYNDKTNLFLEEGIDVKEPFHLFEKWFNEARNNPTMEPTAMCLSTATKNAVPSARFVLCKGYSKEGFRFFTHYTSRKGQELEENPHCALTFYWPYCKNRSVRIEGVAEKLPFSDADIYFNSRPYQSQIGALCSNQSKPIQSRDVLGQKERELKSLYKEGEVPRPPQWGGYLVKPHIIEFWQGQTDRIHDRIRFRKPKNEEVPDGILTHQGEDGWIYERLAP